VVVVAGTKRFFVAMLWVCLALWLCSEAEQAMCQMLGEHSHKKYDSYKLTAKP